jgi:hypothetical protein
MLNYKTKEVVEENLSIPIFTAGKNQKPEVAVSKGILKSISLETLTLSVGMAKVIKLRYQPTSKILHIKTIEKSRR